MILFHWIGTMNQETRNCRLRQTQKGVSKLHSSIKYFPAGTTLGKQTWRPETASLFPKSDNAGLKEVSLALVLTHICTIYSLPLVFQPLFLTSRLIQRTAKLGPTMWTVITRENCVQQIFDKCTNNLLATTPLHRFGVGIPTSTIANKTRIQPIATSNRQDL